MWRRSGVHENIWEAVDDAFGYKASIQEQSEIAMMKMDAIRLARYTRKSLRIDKTLRYASFRRLRHAYSSPSSDVSEKLMRDVKVWAPPQHLASPMSSLRRAMRREPVQSSLASS